MKLERSSKLSKKRRETGDRRDGEKRWKIWDKAVRKWEVWLRRKYSGTAPARGRSRDRLPEEKGHKHLWWERPEHSTAKPFHCPVELAGANSLCQWLSCNDLTLCEYWHSTWWHSAFEGFFGLFKHYKVSHRALKGCLISNYKRLSVQLWLSLGSFCLWGPLLIPWLHTTFPLCSLTHSACRVDSLWGMFS